MEGSLKAAQMRILSVDIETYGACATDHQGRSLPVQNCFHPVKSVVCDRCPRESLVLTAAVTEVKWPGGELSLEGFADAEPGCTRVFLMHDHEHRRWLSEWLRGADVLLGMNIQFDILYLASVPGFEFLMSNRRRRLVDLAVINYLHSELRPERSLKDICALFRIYRYPVEQAIRSGFRYRSPNDPGLIEYNARDAHNVVLAASVVSDRIRSLWPDSEKLKPPVLMHYSEVLWTAIWMSWRGVPVSRALMKQLRARCLQDMNEAIREARRHDLILTGAGSNKSKRDFVEKVCRAIDEAGLVPNGTIFGDDRLQKTPTGLMSVSEENRKLLAGLLPRDHPMRAALDAFSAYEKASKLISTYIAPIIGMDSEPPDPRVMALPVHSDTDVPCDPGLSDAVCYPTWYVVPTQTKDTTRDQGGTEQGRITCKYPAIQTFPGELKRCIQPPSPDDAIIWADLSQIELRVAALLSGEPSLLEAFRSGGDLHTERAIYLFGEKNLENMCGRPFDRTNPGFEIYRATGKATVFADLYLASAATMKATVLRNLGIDLPLSLFRRLERDRPRLRPKLWAWQQSLLKEVFKKGRLTLPITGQSRSFLGPKSLVRKAYLNTIVNFPVQTVAGNTMLAIQAALARRIPPPSSNPWAFQFVNIYDAVGIVCRRDRLGDLMGCLHEAVNEVASPQGYWGKLQAYYGHVVRLTYNSTVHTYEATR